MDKAKQLTVILRELHNIRDRLQATEYSDAVRVHDLLLELNEALSLLVALSKLRESK